MSISVSLDELPLQIAQRSWAYLLTVADDGRAHLVATVPRWEEANLVVEVGRRTRDNAARQPLVTLVYPPTEPHGFSLIVDVTAAVDGESIVLKPEAAVLHRPAIAA